MDERSPDPRPPTDVSAWRTIPNLLSALRLASVPVFLWLFARGADEAAVILYGAGASTDFLDGYIARRTGTVTELGKILDPLSDRVFIVALAIALVSRDVLPWWLALAIVGRDLAVLSAVPLLDRRGVERIPVNRTGKTATASLLVGLTWLAWSQTEFPLHGAGLGVGRAFTAVGAVLYWVAAVQYANEARARLRIR